MKNINKAEAQKAILYSLQFDSVVNMFSHLLPPDVTISQIGLDGSAFVITLVSESFDVVLTGDEIPVQPLEELSPQDNVMKTMWGVPIIKPTNSVLKSLSEIEKKVDALLSKSNSIDGFYIRSNEDE